MNSPRCCTAGIAVALVAFGCASGGRWEAALREDTPRAYHRFLRESPDSPHVEEARERLAFVRLREKPSGEAYEKFRSRYPDSPLLAELRPVVEEGAFALAHARGSLEAYREFAAEFPGSELAERAAGNVEYLEQGGFRGQPAELAAFAARHPTSDFALEARRTAAAVKARGETSIRSIGLVLEVSRDVPDADRLARSFADRVKRDYAQVGTSVVLLGSASDPRAARVDAVLTLRHSEQLTQPRVDASGASSPGVLARTQLTLARRGETAPVWSEEFTHRMGIRERPEGMSILFDRSGKYYWDAFYVPAAAWSSQLAVRPPFSVEQPGVDVAVAGHRAVVLFKQGDFQVVEISDPAEPEVVGVYRRPRDMTTWSGVRIIDGRAVIFGPDGIELVDLGTLPPKRLRTLPRTAVGSVTAVARVTGGLLAAGSQGLQLVKGGQAQPQPLFEGTIDGLAMVGDRAVFADDSFLYVASLPMLLRGKAEGQMRLDRGFGTSGLRTSGTSAVLLGERSVLVVDLANPRRPTLRARLNTSETGAVSDAIIAGGRLFLLGERGLQITDASGARIRDAADVDARLRVDSSGRHLVALGDGGLQVVDATPFVSTGGLAAPRR